MLAFSKLVLLIVSLSILCFFYHKATCFLKSTIKNKKAKTVWA